MTRNGVLADNYKPQPLPHLILSSFETFLFGWLVKNPLL